jgi:AraC-like DNA-binding protein
MSGQPTSAPALVGKTAGLNLTPPAPEQLLQSKYRALTRRNLGPFFDRLFAEFTGLHFHIAWAPAGSHDWETRTLPTGCSVCCRLNGASRLKACHHCGPRQLARALHADGKGHRFRCHLGVRNYWIPMRVRGVTVAIAYLQASTARPESRAPKRAGHVETKVVPAAEFFRAGRLLRLIVQHVQTLDLAELRQAELSNADRAVLTLEKEQARLQEVLQRHLPIRPEVARRSGPESHADQVVQNLMKRIEQDYGTPLTLRQCAGLLGLNAAYLSALFSRAVGVPFKTYLTEVRLERAKALLDVSAKNLSEVAAAVGYASENRFRIAFKKANGLSPKLWRETMQANLPPASLSV